MYYDGFVEKQNFDSLLEALEQADPEAETSLEDRLLEEVLNKLKGIEGTEFLQKEFKNVISMVSMNSYAQGIRMGARLSRILGAS